MNQPAHGQPSEEIREVKLAEQVPKEWGFSEGATDLWLSCYRIFLAKRAELIGTEVRFFDALGCRLLMFFGQPKYIDPGRMRLAPWDGVNPVEMIAEGAQERTADPGAYLMVVTPYPRDAVPEDEPRTRQRIKALVGLVRAMLGRNAAFDVIYENIIHSDGKTTASTRGIENPLWFGSPRLTVEALSDLQEISQRLSQDETRSNRLSLALRWLDEGVTTGGVDSFIRLWIALETLGMPDGTDIRQLIEALSRAYGVKPEEAQERFLVGRLFGLRGAIVHDGKQPALHSNMLAYMLAIFVDIFREKLGMRPVNAAQAWLDRADPDLPSLITKAISGA